MGLQKSNMTEVTEHACACLPNGNNLGGKLMMQEGKGGRIVGEVSFKGGQRVCDGGREEMVY